MADTNEKSLKGTKTEQNLATAYLAESAAYSRYTFFAKAAEKEGYPQYSDLFAETADNELHHAKLYLKCMNQENVVAPAMSVDAGVIGTTLANLKVAAHEEEVEGVELYTKAAKVAKEEGFDEISDLFANIATIEDHHRQRFLKMAERIEEGTVWKSEDGKPIRWQCRVCGYITEGVEPPLVCPVCKHPRKYYEREETNF